MRGARKARGKGLVYAAVAAMGASLAPQARATHLSQLASGLVISKSSNRNQVKYAVQVDEACAPAGADPMHPYWQMLERGSDVTEPLDGAELRVLGPDHQEVTGHEVRFALRGLPGRTVTVTTALGADGACASSVETVVAGVRARLAGVFVQQRLFGIDYVLLTGWAADGSPVRERVAP